MTQNPLTVQHGGKHYVNLAIQPIEFCYTNRYDPAAFSVLKYITRYRTKNGLEDLKKARHFVQILHKLRFDDRAAGVLIQDARKSISILDYITKNGIGGEDAQVLLNLHAWVTGSVRSLGDDACANLLLQQIDYLIQTEYPDKGPKQ